MIDQDIKPSNKKVIILVVIIFLLAGFFLLWRYYKPGQVKFPREQQLPPPEKLEKVDQLVTSLPKEFPTKLPIYPGSTIISSYNLVYQKTGLPKDGVIIFDSVASVTEIYNYYKGQLLPPTYNLSKQTYPIESENFKILNFSTSSFMLTIRIERIGAKTQVQLINTNLDREVEMYKNL